MIKGGVEASVYGLAAALGNAHDVIVFDTPRKDIHDSVEDIDGMTVYRFRNTGKRNIGMIKRIPDLLRLVRENPVDICHIHGSGPFSYYLFNALKKEGITAIVTVHGLIRVEKKKLLNRRFSLKTLFQYAVQSMAEKRLLSSCEHAIVDTQYVADSIQSFGLKHLPQLHVIPQGIREIFLQTHCSDSSLVILSVGAFSRRKGHLLLVQAFEKTFQSVPQARLVICGTVAEKDYYDGLVSYVSSSPCRERITIQPDATLKELIVLFQGAHLFALHSQEESQGIVLAEAMATGLPVVSTNVGGIPDVIKNGITGYLTEYGDAESFSRHLVTLLTDVPLWQKMSRQCIILGRHYDWGGISHSIEALYLTLLHA